MQKALVAYKNEKNNINTANELDLQSSTIKEKYSRRSNNTSENTSKVRVKICSESGLLASSRCPRTYEVSYDKGTEPKEVCTLDHKTHDLSNEGIGNGKESISTSGPHRPGTSSDNGRYVTVSICADSGYIANEYCPEVIAKRFKADEAPTRVCQIHRAPE
jgi:hypothetical protein